MLRKTERKVNLEGGVLLSFGESDLEKDLSQDGWGTWAPIPSIPNRSLQTMLWGGGRAARFMSDCTVVCRLAGPGHTCLAAARAEQR